MTKLKDLFFLPLALCLALGLVGCPGDDDDDDSSDDDDTTAMDDDDTTGDDDDTTGDDDDDDDDDDGVDDFVFSDEPASAYTRVDRMGMPAIATAVITSKDAYNAGEPADDIDDFAGEVISNVDYVHNGTGNGGEFPGLDAALQSLSLTPCAGSSTEPAVGECIDQALSVGALPDTLKINLLDGAGFPNGRALPDPVIDVTLAVVLLDLDTHAPDALVGALNPTSNDVAFDTSFPYLAPAQ